MKTPLKKIDRLDDILIRLDKVEFTKCEDNRLIGELWSVDISMEFDNAIGSKNLIDVKLTVYYKNVPAISWTASLFEEIRLVRQFYFKKINSIREDEFIQRKKELSSAYELFEKL